MIHGIFNKIHLENVPSAETTHDKYVREDKKRGEDTVNAEDRKKDDAIESQAAIEQIVNVAKFFNREIRLEIEKDLDIMIVKVIDSETERVIRQIPPEELVELSKNARDLKGLLINKEG